ncbi:MAG: thioredoxin family protein [Tannerellaceae bacterium]|jgi:thiol:disulfide interchange protein DsbD|nr:thioredoxin family protein [Tannerellaceae bacterium]
MQKTLYIIVVTLLSLCAEAQIFAPVKWRITLDESVAGEKSIVFSATIDKGWHLYDMDLPPGGPVSTSFTFETLHGAELVGKPTATSAPTSVHDDMFKMELRWYSGSVTFRQKLKITDAKTFKVVGEVEYIACDDARCLPPERETFAFDRKNIKRPDDLAAVSPQPVSEKEDTPVVAEAITVPSTSPSEEVPIRVAPLRQAEHAVSELWQSVTEELKSFGDVSLSAADMSWLYIFFAGFIGGLLALLTPCVWPMIPMTVSFFLKRTSSRRKSIVDALVYGLAIIVIYVSMGLAITALFGASALNDLSTNAVFNILFSILLIFFAVSFLGAFEITLPSSWTNRMDSKAERTTGIISIFFMAFTLALVSFSCTGPIIGTLLVQAATMGKMSGPAIGMSGFAIALSIPFALFSVFPGMLKRLPRSGGWLNSVKIVLGFLELALALKFLSVADLAYGWELLDRETFLVLWIVLFALLGLYLLGKLRFAHDSEAGRISVPRLLLAIASLSFSLYMLPGLWGAPLKAVSAFAPPLYTQDFSLYDSEVHAAFEDYEAGMEYAASAGKPVIVDFSGFGCVNCRKMEASVWTDPSVKHLLEKDYVLITLYVDDKTKLAKPIEVVENGKKRKLKTVGDRWSYLQSSKFGANAQPFYVLLDNSGHPLAPSYAYDEDIAKYHKFLTDGLAKYRK